MNAKMKTLSLALVGLAGFGVAGAAAAGSCPGSPVPPWTLDSELGGGVTTIVAGGLDASTCSLDTSLGASGASQAGVADTSPANEPRYRVQFLVDTSGLSPLVGTESVGIFNASAAAGYPTGGSRRILQVGLVPAAGGAIRLALLYACDNGTTYQCVAVTPNLVAGVNRIEFDIVTGSAGSIRYWLNATGPTEPAPDGDISGFDNAGWVGVDTVILGLGAPAPDFSDNHAGEIVSFDTFDSRRATYIGSN